MENTIIVTSSKSAAAHETAVTHRIALGGDEGGIHKVFSFEVAYREVTWALTACRRGEEGAYILYFGFVEHHNQTVVGIGTTRVAVVGPRDIAMWHRLVNYGSKMHFLRGFRTLISEFLRSFTEEAPKKQRRNSEETH